MTPIQTILVPMDFGAPSEAALAYAVDLAEALGARLYLLHTYQVPLVGFPMAAAPAVGDLAGQIAAEGQKALEAAVSKVQGRKVEITPVLKQGDPREVILEMAKDVRANLIVMGTHGRRGIARALIGSVTESVVRTADVPVLTVHGVTEMA